MKPEVKLLSINFKTGLRPYGGPLSSWERGSLARACLRARAQGGQRWSAPSRRTGGSSQGSS